MNNEKDNEKKRALRMGHEVIMVCSLITSSIGHIDDIEDPAARYAMIVVMLQMSVDISIAAASSTVLYDASFDTDEETRKIRQNAVQNLSDLKQRLQDVLQCMKQWNFAPSYDPDTPFGRHVMETGKRKFEKYASAAEEKRQRT